MNEQVEIFTAYTKNWRIGATIDRLISNIPAACKVLQEEGYISLAGQLRRDQANLVYWQEHGGLTWRHDESASDATLQEGYYSKGQSNG